MILMCFKCIIVYLNFVLNKLVKHALAHDSLENRFDRVSFQSWFLSFILDWKATG